MIKLKALTIRDFGPLGVVHLTFQSGLWLISGDNRDTDAAVSNGSGKSHLLDALQWALFGETNDGTKGDSLIRNGQPSVVVGVVWDDDGREFIATRTKDRGKSVKLSLVQDEIDVSLATPELTQQNIELLMGMDVKTWSNTVVYGQGDLVRFADPKTTDSERKAILKKILRLDVLDRALKAARRQLEASDKAISEFDARVVKGEAYIEGLGDTAEMDEEISGAQTQLDADAKVASTADRIKKVLALLDQKIAEGEEANEQLVQQRRTRGGCDKALAKCDSDGAVAASRARTLDEQVRKLELGVCPTCGTKTTPTPAILKRIAELKQELEQTARRVSDLLVERERLVENVTEAQRGVEELESTLAQDREWREKKAKMQSDLRNAENAAASVDRLRQRIEAAKKRKAEHASKLQKARATMEEVVRSRDAEQANHAVIEYWVKAFSNAGLPSLMMDSIVPTITDGANKYLEILADGDITVNFDTQSKIKSGEMRDKLSMDVCIEGVQGARPSGGQKRKISIAVDLALMDLVASRERAAIDFLGMDEVLDGLDQAGKTRVMDLLRKLRETRSTIMVVSHDDGIAEAFEKQIVIRKQDGVSTLEE